MRKDIFEIIEPADEGEKLSHIYDIGMIIMIVISLTPLGFKKETPALIAMDTVSVIVFIIDYILRWITADYKMEKQGAIAFIRYPFTFMAII